MAVLDNVSHTGVSGERFADVPAHNCEHRGREHVIERGTIVERTPLTHVGRDVKKKSVCV